MNNTLSEKKEGWEKEFDEQLGHLKQIEVEGDVFESVKGVVKSLIVKEKQRTALEILNEIQNISLEPAKHFTIPDKESAINNKIDELKSKHLKNK